MSKKAKLEEIKEVAQETSEPFKKDPEAEMFEKVTLMANMTACVKNPELEKAIKNLPDGDKIYSLLVKAVHQEIQMIMGKSQESLQEMHVNMKEMAKAMSTFNALINGFNNSQLVAILGAIQSKLKGSSPAQPAQQLPPGYVPPQSNQVMEDRESRLASLEFA